MIALVVVIMALWMIIKRKTLRDWFQLLKKIALRVWEGVSAVRHLKGENFYFLYCSSLGLVPCGGLSWIFCPSGNKRLWHQRSVYSFVCRKYWNDHYTRRNRGLCVFLEKTMMIYGLSEGVASAFGWLLWLSNTAVIIFGGLVSFAALPWYNKKKLQRSALV